ncbi:MAG: enoyl-ACP reductase [Chloroflexi bacterium TMED230]|nr:MAG: enoyl-ACP reductase [Chloroflexi bacterium TMED230]
MAINIDLSNKKGIIFGLANQRSIAWSISEKLMDAGAQLAFTYLDERLLKGINNLLEGNDSLLLKCDANDESEVKKVMKIFYEKYGEIDFIVHSVAFANREDLGGNFSDLSKEGFSLALETSSYSLVTIAREASKYFSKDGGSVISMTFDASTRVYPGYNVMGTAKAALENINRQLSSEFGSRQIRFNSISAGPLPSLSARSIPGFVKMRKAHEERSPIKRPITHEEVANTALFLISDLSSGITGSIIPVDGGYGIIAL